jgi:hypothetical protein
MKVSTGRMNRLVQVSYTEDEFNAAYQRMINEMIEDIEYTQLMLQIELLEHSGGLRP